MKIKKHHKQISNVPQKSTCLSFGSKDHPQSKCRFRNVICHKCNKKGHTVKVCHSKATSNQFKVNTIFSILNEHIIGDHPIQIPIQTDGVKVNFELDTGSPITIINEYVWKLMEKPKLYLVKLTYNSFAGHPIPFKGEKMVKVNYNDRCAQLPLVIYAIVSDSSIQNINSEFKNLNDLLIRYDDIFKDGLGCCKMKPHLHIKPNVIPKFCKPRSLPFAYSQAVENDLNRLVTEGVLEPITVSKWAAPIVLMETSD
ncbi:unnamed protein product [Rotaria sp. Silwood1]|nr:unnamed protein product [Rotaria sp. Silwood1]CAF1623213.1 unnamed protein product [Rotaria sp. Silwood1]CAF3743624.1 unnamed protein product [Rotaria sp. Silwood1]CAF3768631.1 unnamed protein product [Rotaria sp. Silwood1]CAF3822780.1 unnamed protein product [Rotaria sp. Silwood1]